MYILGVLFPMRKKVNRYQHNTSMCRCCTEIKRCLKKNRFCPRIAVKSANGSIGFDIEALKRDVPLEDSLYWPEPETDYFYVPDDELLDVYYIRYINDCLREIRSKRIAFTYKVDHIRDILRFEPNIRVRFHGDIFCVDLVA